MIAARVAAFACVLVGVPVSVGVNVHVAIAPRVIAPAVATGVVLVCVAAYVDVTDGVIAA